MAKCIHSPMHVQIDELVLEGFGADAGVRIRTALEGELERLVVAEGTGSMSTLDVAAVDAGTFDGSSPVEAAGVRLAQAIHGVRASTGKPTETPRATRDKE